MHQQTEWQLKCKCHLVASTLDTQRQVNAPVCDRDIAVNYWRGCPPQTGRSASISRKMPVRKLPNSGRLGGVGSGPATGGRWPDHLEAMMTVPWPRSDISTPPLPVSGHANFIRTQPSQGLCVRSAHQAALASIPNEILSAFWKVENIYIKRAEIPANRRMRSSCFDSSGGDFCR